MDCPRLIAAIIRRYTCRRQNRCCPPGDLPSTALPELLRLPGYPLFLIPGLVASQPELIAIALQLLLSAATIWLFMTSSCPGPIDVPRRGAAFLAAIEPMSIVFSCMLMTETLFTFLLVLSVQRLLRYLATESLAALVQTALLLAMAAFVRPVGDALPPSKTAT